MSLDGDLPKGGLSLCLLARMDQDDHHEVRHAKRIILCIISPYKRLTEVLHDGGYELGAIGVVVVGRRGPGPSS